VDEWATGSDGVAARVLRRRNGRLTIWLCHYSFNGPSDIAMTLVVRDTDKQIYGKTDTETDAERRRNGLV